MSRGFLIARINQTIFFLNLRYCYLDDGIGDACEASLTDVFKNQGQCIAFVNNNPEDAETLGITKEKCQEDF